MDGNPRTIAHTHVSMKVVEELAVAEDKSAVARRTVQEIFDEEVNAPTFNRNRAETRRHIQMSTIDHELSGELSDVPYELLGDDYSNL